MGTRTGAWIDEFPVAAASLAVAVMITTVATAILAWITNVVFAATVIFMIGGYVIVRTSPYWGDKDE